MKKVDGSMNQKSFKPNLCCLLAGYVKCPRCTWTICRPCLVTPLMTRSLKKNKNALSGLILFALHPICKCEKCMKDIHWSKANTDHMNWQVDLAYICTPCLDKGRVSISAFTKALRGQ